MFILFTDFKLLVIQYNILYEVISYPNLKIARGSVGTMVQLEDPHMPVNKLVPSTLHLWVL